MQYCVATITFLNGADSLQIHQNQKMFILTCRGSLPQNTRSSATTEIACVGNHYTARHHLKSQISV